MKQTLNTVWGNNSHQFEILLFI